MADEVKVTEKDREAARDIICKLCLPFNRATCCTEDGLLCIKAEMCAVRVSKARTEGARDMRERAAQTARGYGARGAACGILSLPLEDK